MPYCDKILEASEPFIDQIVKREDLKEKRFLITGATGMIGSSVLDLLLFLNERKQYGITIYAAVRNDSKIKKRYGIFAQKEYFHILPYDATKPIDFEYSVDYVIHAAALKQVPACEYNPNEAIKTNIHGAMNIIEAALDTNVKKVVALSTDKAVNPVNLYGGTKLVSDKLFIAANAYVGNKDINFSIVRYGNVAGSRGSIIPFFRKLIADGQTELPITDLRMTRFWISLEQGVQLVIKALEEAKGGETFISKIPSFKITDLAEAMLPGCGIKEIGIRPGEKLHEIMVTTEDSFTTYEYEKHFIVYPQMTWNNKQLPDMSGHKVAEGFSYSSDNNTEWLSVEQIRELLKTVKTV